MSVVWEKGVNTGKIDPMKYVSITSSTAAKIFNIYPKKGRIAENSDADIVIWDPQATKTISAKTHKQAVDYNIFEGMKVRGLAQYTISRGKVVYENSKLDVKPGTGKYIKLEPNCNYVFNAIRVREEVNKPICVHRCHPSKCVCN
uniref:Amidohydrolase-related domain-containing protein n=1 Tax=Panagrolaimus sp. JU765 TaxID=591449 RepID=A0AC34QB84_9BILA